MQTAKKHSLILISILIAAVLVLICTLICAKQVTAYAAEADEIPNATAPHNHADMTELKQAEYDALIGGNLTAGNYYLGENISGKISVNGEVTLCLNGKTITRDGVSGNVITVLNEANFTLCDCTGEGVITGGDNYWGGGVSVEGGRVREGFGDDGCWQGGTFTMTGGTITGNKAGAGGGVCLMAIAHDVNAESLMMRGSRAGIDLEQVKRAEFTMLGGAIIDNTVENGNGGGVYVASGTLFTMLGGRISGNTVANEHDYYDCGNGGGVCVGEYGTFTMEGGEIKDNNGLGGGGICVMGGLFTLEDGTISGNVAAEGGGVAISGVSSTFIMNGGEISHNNAGDEIYGGTCGGVCIYEGSTFEMYDGVISDNESSMAVGGVVVGSLMGRENAPSKFKMFGGEIRANSSPLGGGVIVVNGTFTMSGGTISENTQVYDEDMKDSIEMLGLLGGGVFVGNPFALIGGDQTESEFEMSGNPVIAGNTALGNTNNVCLYNGSIITVTDELIDGAQIGVNLMLGEIENFASSAGVVATGFVQTDAPTKYFISDNADYGCVLVSEEETGELSIGEHVCETEFTVDEEPTCTEKGSKSYHCTVCDGKKDVTEIPANGHTVSPVDVVNATCEEDGVIAHIHCSVCGKDFIDGVEKTAEDLKISALGHDWGDWTVKKEATEAGEGEEQRVCSRDGSHVETRAIPKIVAGQKHDIALIIVVAILSVVVLGEVAYLVYHAIRSQKARKEEKQ